MSEITDYWLDRGRKSVWWKGEEYYTIAAVPYYHERRRVLLKMLAADLSTIKAGQTICDFGCGDGYYLRFFRDRFPNLQWIGVDVSDTMLERARQRNPGVELHNTVSQIGGMVDHCVCIGVFTCIVEQALLTSIFDDIAEKCRSGAMLVVFEQIAPHEYRKPTLTRRPAQFYIDAFEKRGFRLKEHKLVYYNLHVLFERTFAKLWYRWFGRGESDHEIRINSNQSSIFRWMSLLFAKLSSRVVREPDASKWGYCYLVFQKE